MSNAVQDIATSKLTAGAAVVGSILGLTISEWAALLTALFVLMQIVVLSPKFFAQLCDYVRRFRAWRQSKKDSPPQA